MLVFMCLANRLGWGGAYIGDTKLYRVQGSIQVTSTRVISENEATACEGTRSFIEKSASTGFSSKRFSMFCSVCVESSSGCAHTSAFLLL